MSTLYITEFARQGRDGSGRLAENGTPEETPLAEQVIAIGGASAQSVAFNAATTIVRIHTDAICSLAIGANPTATSANRRMAANTSEQIAVAAGSGYRVAVIANV